jgi:hypothetical protein
MDIMAGANFGSQHDGHVNLIYGSSAMWRLLLDDIQYKCFCSGSLPNESPKCQRSSRPVKNSG